MYIILIVAGVLLIIYSLFPNTPRLKKKKKAYPHTFWGYMEYIAQETPMRYLIFKEGSKSWNADLDTLNKYGIDISVPAYEMVRFLAAFILFIIFLFINSATTSINNISDQVMGFAKTGIVAVSDGTQAAQNQGVGLTRYLSLLIYSMVGYMIVPYFLRYYSTWLNTKIEDELSVLEVYAVILLDAQKTVKEVIDELTGLSKYTKKYLAKVSNEYAIDPYKALNTLQYVKNDELKRFGLILQNSMTSTSFITDHLKRHITSLQEKKRTSKKSGTFAMMNVTLLMEVLPLISFAIFMIYPWLVSVMSTL